MQQHVERIRADQQRHGEPGQGAASVEQIARLRASLIARFGAILPDDYAAFLQLSNGIDHDGLLLYGASQSVEAPGPHHFWQGIAAANAAWREGVGHDAHIVLGETGMDLLTVATDGTDPVLRDRISHDVNARFDSVAAAVSWLLQHHG